MNISKNAKKKSVNALVLAVLLSINFQSIPTATAAEKGWRYWGYFQAAPGDKTWTAAMTGPTVDIEDGAVEGWSFVFSSDDVPSVAPKVKPKFSAICGDMKVKKGSKRIAVVIDFGAKSYAPKCEKRGKVIKKCVRTSLASQGVDVLGQVAKVRGDASGLICGLNGYPAEECGIEITTPKALVK